jgi:hypothetical protein
MGLDFVALGTGAEIRQALDTLEARFADADERARAVEAVRAGVEQLEQRLNTARRSAWVAVPVEAGTVAEGDLVVQKDGTLTRVLEVIASAPDGWDRPGHVILSLEHGSSRKDFTLPIDRPVPVLRRPTADALDILTRQLGAQVTK